MSRHRPRPPGRSRLARDCALHSGAGVHLTEERALARMVVVDMDERLDEAFAEDDDDVFDD